MLPPDVVVREEGVEQPADRRRRQRQPQLAERRHRGQRAQRVRQQVVQVVEHDHVADRHAQQPEDVEVQVVDDREVVELVRPRGAEPVDGPGGAGFDQRLV